MAQTRNQQYSDNVFRRITGYLASSGYNRQADESVKKRAKKYKGLCKRSGGMLRTMGLIQFLAFLHARGQKRSEAQYKDLFEHLRMASQDLDLISAASPDVFLASVRNEPVPKYMRTTREILALLQWHKQLADVLIEGNAEEHSDEQGE